MSALAIRRPRASDYECLYLTPAEIAGGVPYDYIAEIAARGRRSCCSAGAVPVTRLSVLVCVPESPFDDLLAGVTTVTLGEETGCLFAEAERRLREDEKALVQASTSVSPRFMVSSRRSTFSMLQRRIRRQWAMVGLDAGLGLEFLFEAGEKGAETIVRFTVETDGGGEEAVTGRILRTDGLAFGRDRHVAELAAAASFPEVVTGPRDLAPLVRAEAIL